MKSYNFKVEKKNAGERLDKYILSKLGKKLSRTFIQHLITEGLVKVDRAKVKSHYKVRYNQDIKLTLPQPKHSSFKPIRFDLDIIYEDKHMIVVNKPPTMVVHPVSRYSKKVRTSPTLVNALLYHCNNLSHIGGELKPGIVHRLDKETSGVIVVAKTDFAHRKLSKSFSQREIKKIYIGIVLGKMELDQGVIELPIGRSSGRKTDMSISYIKGKPAITEYKVIRRFDDYTLVKAIPETGRTHQIRVHFAYIGHPILGDKRYGAKKFIKRQALHAYKITLKHPVNDKYMTFTCPVPEDMKELIPNVNIND